MIVPLTNPARSSLRGIACPASSHIGRAGNLYASLAQLDRATEFYSAGSGFESSVTRQSRPRRVLRGSSLLDCAQVASRAGAAFPLFGLRLTGAILSAATNHNARRFSGRAGELLHGLFHDLRETCATARDNRAALNLFGILPDRAANDGRAYFPVSLAGHCPRRTAHTTALCFSLQTSGASVPAFAGGC